MMDLHRVLPWTQKPLIINAPMGGIAVSDLAIAVSRAGGLGLIGDDCDLPGLDKQLQEVEKALPRHNDLLPIGVGLLTFIVKFEEAIAVLRKHRPTVVWLFAAKQLDDYATWVQRVRQECPGSQVWIQVGNVDAALKVAQTCRPDTICVQGADAGGHGFEDGAGLISLLPEVKDTLSEAGFGDIALVASGGIAEARSAAAALVLGAQGVVMGTRFLSAPETDVHPIYQAAVVAARDGGKQTKRSKFFDNLRGPNIWPEAYDGRSLRMESWADYTAGVSIEEVRQRHSEAIKNDNKGYGQQGKGYTAMWAGTGVGHVKKVQPAAEIVEEVRSAIAKAVDGARSRM